MWMYHPASEDLNPAGTFTESTSFASAFEASHIHLCTWLCKREMMRSEFCLCLFSKQLFCKHFQCSFQICKGNIFIDHKTFNLMEGWRMCCIHFIRTEYSSRCDHTDRQLALLHHSRLNRRSLCTQHNVLIHIKGILFIFCRMPIRNVEFLEVVQVVFYFRSFPRKCALPLPARSYLDVCVPPYFS